MLELPVTVEDGWAAVADEGRDEYSSWHQQPPGEIATGLRPLAMTIRLSLKAE